MQTKTQVYTIRGIAYETDCDYCGWPLYDGDRAVDVNEGSAIVCSKSCARKHVEAEREVRS